MISKNNDGGKNYGGPGTIKSVDKDATKVLEVVVYEDGRPDEDDEDDDYIKKIKNSFSYLFFYLPSLYKWVQIHYTRYNTPDIYTCKETRYPIRRKSTVSSNPLVYSPYPMHPTDS